VPDGQTVKAPFAKVRSFDGASHDGPHHFISVGAWDAASLEAELTRQAGRVIGGRA